MPRGAPDYSNVTAYGPMVRLDDMAELAARLGSPDTHDRSGRVLFLTSFDSGMVGFVKTQSGSGASVEMTASDARTGSYSVKLTAGSDGGQSAQIAKTFPYPTLGKFGLEFSVRFGDHVQYLIWAINHRDGANEHVYQCMYMPDDDKIVVTIAGYSAVDAMTDIHLSEEEGLFHTIKLVSDFEEEKYDTLRVNERIADLSDKEEYVFANTASPHLVVIFTLYGKAGSNGSAYIDDLIITQAEP